MDPTGQSRRLTRRTLGLGMVALALGLAGLGIVLAFRQVQSQSSRLVRQVELRAGVVARTARELFHQQLDTVLARAGGPLPPWIDGLFTWDGIDLATVEAPKDAPAGFNALLVAHLSTTPLGPEVVGAPAPTELTRDRITGFPVLTARQTSIDSEGRPVIRVARIHLERLRTTLIEPLLPSDGALQLVEVDDTRSALSQPVANLMGFWAMQPATSFVREQRAEVIGQTLVYLGLTIFALGTLLATMWFLSRVVRREVALAELKANFVADVSHELKTPLAVIRLYSETLQDGRVGSEEKRQNYYSIITRESTRLTNMINNILDFARIEAGRKEYTMQPTDVGKVVREAYEAYQVQLDHNGFEYHLGIEEPLPRIDADPDAISQVLFNLMSNAVKYSEDERYLAIEITSDTRRNRRGILISVHDHGIGIRPEDRARLFEGFFRAADGRVRRQGGAGLGLALVKHIVDAHHGILDVESRLVKGTSFRVFLPASDREGSPDEAASPEGRGLTRPPSLG